MIKMNKNTLITVININVGVKRQNCEIEYA